MKKLILIFIVLLLLSGCATVGTNNTINVSKFYDGKNGYSLSIPTGNKSTCVWTWVGGNAQIPDTQTTLANTATEKHHISFPDMALLSEFKVNCTDDFGNSYQGIFPK